MSSLPLKKIERIAYDNGVLNLNTVPADVKFKIYKLTFDAIDKELKVNPRVLTKEALLEIDEALNDMRNGFHELLFSDDISEESAEDIKLITPLRNEAQASLGEALATLEQEGKTRKYFEALMSCHDQIILIKHQLEEH